MSRDILVVKRGTLFSEGLFQGFLPKEKKDYIPTILQNIEYQERNDSLENDPNFQQIIPYVWIINTKTKKVFLYKRSTEGGEGRLHNKYSGGVGGHIDRDTEFHSLDPITDAMMRELKEEVKMQNYPKPKFIGFLNDDSDSVGKVHFGVVAIAETEENVLPIMHMAEGKFYTVQEVENLINDPSNELEPWSKFSWIYVKNHIQNKNTSSMQLPKKQPVNNNQPPKPSLKELKDKILEVYVTSATDQVYAIKNTVPQEVFGAFGSYFSRNPKDFRQHLWDAITGEIEGEKAHISERDLRFLIKDTFKKPSDFIESGLLKSQDFFKKWYGKYSHKSIANTVSIPMVANNVSQLFAKELAYDQLAFFIEQSTRYVKFDVNKMYHDPDIMNSHHKDLYLQTLKTMADAYEKFREHAIAFYKKRIPYEKWLTLQKNPNTENLKRKYEREIDGKALDIARFLLPQAIKTNIAWILDARSTEFDIAAWKGHPLKEMQEIAKLLEKSAGQIAPSLLKYTEKNEYYAEKLNAYADKLKSNPAQPFTKGIDLISADPDAFERTIAHVLHKHNRGATFRQRYEEVKNLTFEEKIKILKTISQNKKEFDEWMEMEEDFDLTHITLEIRTDIGALRDWRRHQKWDRGESLFTLDNGHYRPEILNEMPPEAAAIFDRAIEAAKKAEHAMRVDFPFQAQYILPMATMHTLVMTAGLDQLQYMIYTRTTPQGNFSYRTDAINLAAAVCKLMPWLLGYEKYPVEKSFKQAYAEAPIKNIIRIQAFEEGMHE